MSDDRPAAPGPPVDAVEEIHHGNQFVKILRHGSWYFVASLLTKAAGLILVPIYTRYLPPAEYGILGSLDAVSRLAPLFISLYLDASFIRFYYDERRASPERVKTLYSTQFWFVAVWGTLAVGLGLLAAPATVQEIVDVPFLPFMPLVFAAPLFTQLGLMGSQLMRANLRAREVSLINVASFFATASVALVLLIPFGYGVVSLLWGLAVGPFVSFLIFTVIAIRSGVLGWRFEWSTLRRGLAFSIPLIPNLAGGWINGFSNRLILASYGTLQDVGLFTISFQLGYVIYFITDSITQVQNPIAMSALTADAEAGKRQISQFFSVFLWISLAAFLALTLFAEEILTVLAAPSYRSAYVLVGVFALTYVTGGINRVFTVILSYHKRLALISGGAVVAALVNLALMFALVPSFGQSAAAWSFFVSGLIYMAWLIVCSQRVDRLRLDWPLIVPTLLSAAFVAAGYIVMEQLLTLPKVAELGLKMLLMATYVGAVVTLPGLEPLRRGIADQVRAVRAR